MHEPARVSGIERLCDLAADRDRAGGIERSLLTQERFEIGALHVAHGQIELTLVLAGVVDRNDVRVLERGGELGLGQEALAEVLVLRTAPARSASGRRCASGAGRRRGRRRPCRRGRERLDAVAEELGADRAGRRRWTSATALRTATHTPSGPAVMPYGACSLERTSGRSCDSESSTRPWTSADRSSRQRLTSPPLHQTASVTDREAFPA